MERERAQASSQPSQRFTVQSKESGFIEAFQTREAAFKKAMDIGKSESQIIVFDRMGRVGRNDTWAWDGEGFHPSMSKGAAQ